MKKPKEIKICCWCKHKTSISADTVGLYKIKMTSGRVTKKPFHQKCLKDMVHYSPTKRGARVWANGKFRGTV